VSTKSVQQTAVGGYIIAGSTGSFGAGGSDAWLIETDANGNQVWDKTYGGTGDEFANVVQQTADGGYIIAGITKSFGAGAYDFWLIKTDGNGNNLWEKTFGGNRSDHAYSVQQTADGGYLIAGLTESFGAGGSDAWLIKTDANGNQMWDKTYGGTGDDTFAQVAQQTLDGGYVSAGATMDRSDAWLIKTDVYGNKIWDKTFGGSDWDEAYCVQQTAGGGYIIAGRTRTSGFDYVWLIKTDANGNVESEP
jgi:predicted secreted protein